MTVWNLNREIKETSVLLSQKYCRERIAPRSSKQHFPSSRTFWEISVIVVESARLALGLFLGIWAVGRGGVVCRCISELNWIFNCSHVYTEKETKIERIAWRDADKQHLAQRQEGFSSNGDSGFVLETVHWLSESRSRVWGWSFITFSSFISHITCGLQFLLVDFSLNVQITVPLYNNWKLHVTLTDS